MISGTDTLNSPLQTAEQRVTEETPPCRPDHGAQKHDITPHLKTDGDGIHEQPIVDLSSRTVTDLKALSEPFPGISRHTIAYMNNNPRGHYSATYVNLPDKGIDKLETVQIGNQQLMTLDTAQPFVDENLAADRRFLDVYNFHFLADFLSKHNTIEYIVDIGCYNAKLSLLMQHYLNEQGFGVKVIPVDVNNAYVNEAGNSKPLPINLIPAQDIANASPATTLFTAIHPFTGSISEAKKLNRDIAEGITDFYLTALIKNNPGCFVLTTEDPYVSSPQNYIPPELVYTKHYHAFASFLTPGASQRSTTIRRVKAAEMNAENSAIQRLNQSLATLPEQRESYLASISAMTGRLQPKMFRHPERCWPDYIFNAYLGDLLRQERIPTYESIQFDAEKNRVEIRCWHVYRQATKNSL